MLQFELRQCRGGDGIIPDDGNVRAEQRKGLIQIPGERVEVVYHENIEWCAQRFWERHFAARKSTSVELGDGGTKRDEKRGDLGSLSDTYIARKAQKMLCSF